MAWYSMESESPGTAVASDRGYRLAALQRGSLFLKGAFTCRVHSVFPHAVNLEIPDSPLLYTLVNQEILTHPLTALVAPSLYKTFDTLGIDRGLWGSFKGSLLTLGYNISVDFSSVKESRSCDELVPHLTLSESEFSEQLLCAGTTLERIQRKKHTELRWDASRATAYYMLSGSGALWHPFGEAAHALVEALYAEKPSEALGASRRLIGFGQGLTPSGDDFLCGLILALLMCSEGPYQKRSISNLTLDTWLWGLANELGLESPASGALTGQELTSRVSSTFLYLATQKKFSTLLLQLGRAFTADRASWLTMMALLEAYGHSSGLDSATGFLYGMTAVDTRRN